MEPRTLPEPVIKARSAYQTKAAAGARQIVDDLCARHPDMDDLHAMRALIALWMGDTDRAEAIVSERMAAGPGAGVLAVGAELAEFMADEDGRDTRIRQAAEIDPDNYFVLRAQGVHATTTGDIDTALVLSERSLALYPEDPETYGTRITTLRAGSRLAEAQGMLDGPPEWYVGTSGYRYHLGMAAFQRHDLAEAEAQWRSAVAICPMSAMCWANLSMAQRFLEKLDDAEQSARNALDLNSRSSIALQSLARIAEKRGNKAEAEDYARRAASAVPALSEMAAVSKANKLRASGQLDAGVRLLRQATRSSLPVAARSARRVLIDALITDGKWEEARAEIGKATADGDTGSHAHVARIRLLVHDGKSDEALRECREMLAEPVPFPAVLGPAVSLLLDRGCEQEADVLVARIQRELPGTPADVSSVILALDARGRGPQARALHEAAVRRYPSNQTLRMLSAGFAAQDGRFGHLNYHLQQLPPHMRKALSPQRLLLKRLLRSPRFWWALLRALGRGLFRRKPRAQS